MIDLHCHYLPGVDDGARDMAAALELARAAVANGITTAVLTPHLYLGRWDNLRTVLEPVFTQYKAELANENIALEVKLGAEVHLLPDSLSLLEADEIPFLGRYQNNNVMLLEFPDGQIPVGAMMAVRYLLKRGITPMIAHPERNKDVMRNIQKIVPFVREGCLLQLTAASVCGRFGNGALETANRILDAGFAHVVATDSHNLAHRPPILAEAKAALTARYGVEAAMRLTEFNPGEIANGHTRSLATASDLKAAPVDGKPDVYFPSLIEASLSIASQQAAKDQLVWTDLANYLVPGKILELGAGVGQISELLIRQGREVVCSDHAGCFVDYMKSRGLNAHQIDATQIHRAGLGLFPNVICQNITPFVTTDYSVVARSYQSVFETLEPGGRLVLIHTMNKHHYQLPDSMADHRKLCEKAGFSDIKLFRNQLLPSAAYRAPLALLARPLEHMFAKSFGTRFVLVASKRNV